MNYKILGMVFLLNFTMNSFAQLEERASNADLRGGRILFSIEYSKRNYSLLRSAAGDHSLITTIEKDSNHQKINTRKAIALDDKIAAEFINLKYFMGEIKKCSQANQFEMRGESLEVCPDDKKRLAKVDELVKLINSNK